MNSLMKLPNQQILQQKIIIHNINTKQDQGITIDSRSPTRGFLLKLKKIIIDLSSLIEKFSMAQSYDPLNYDPPVMAPQL